MSDLSLKDEINQRITSLKKNGESDSAFARRCDVSQTTMSGYIGNRSMPKVDPLIKIARANGRSLDWLVTGNEPCMQGKEVVKFSPPLDEIEGWLLERQERFSIDQFVWFKGDTEERFPDFAEYLKKRQGNNSEPGTGTAG